ncbi:phosphoribosylanthranilate isomerase [Methylocapsa palsarum]|uniref:N-(5'-phosphoribosyl)anthranilate isomerase n=1 Tax=Methylocapsa palsarum TaxID=1612308 RepID=A0A1I3ZP79_9HYPH|nr:phosphoribosylanthranilate isomerase [Methylocapsa palsarum]SFK45902.1 phosphoribosylanthranilate isomerase [Methylocapsa palsarum]
MNLIVKICGLSTPETLDVALACGADMVGFVYFDKSPRHVGLERAAALAARVEKRARKVLLTVDADDVSLAAAIAAFDPQALQLHGHESPERIASIRARFGLPVIKAIAIAGRADAEHALLFEAADYLLFDAKPAPGASRPGGNGSAFDWSVLSEIETRKPWLLAGGLDAQNVADAIVRTCAPGVDVSSGVESAPGVKDPARIAAFIAAVRRVGEGGTGSAPGPERRAWSLSRLL